jgi:O-antigen ligase
MLQVAHWLKLFISIIVLSSAIRTRKELLFILTILAFAVALQSAFVGISYFTHKRIGVSAMVTKSTLQGFTSGGATSFVRATGTLGHANQQAMFHTFLTLPLIGLCSLRNGVWRTVFTGVIVASLAATTLTFSRSSWLAWSLGAGVIVFIAHQRGLMTRRIWGYLFMGLLASLMLIVPFSKPIINRITKGDDGASASRIRMLKMATDYIARFPVTGVGPGNFIEQKIAEVKIDRLPNTWLPRNTGWIAPTIGGMEMYEIEVERHWYLFPGVVHNKYLLVCSELGIIGLLLFLWYQWRVLQHCLRASRANTPFGSWTGIGLLAAVCASLLFFNLDLFYDDKTMLVPIFMNLLAMSADRITAQEKLSGA